MNKIGLVATENMKDAAIRQIVRDSMEEALGPPGQQIATPERLEKLWTLVTERYNRMLAHQRAHFLPVVSPDDK